MSEATTTLDGWYCLHDLRSIDWAAWKTLSSDERGQAVSEFLNVVEKWNEVATAKKAVMQCILLLAKKLILCL